MILPLPASPSATAPAVPGAGAGDALAAAAPVWWEVLAAFAPVGTFTAAVVAAVVGLHTIRQRSHSDRRAEFWRRTEWALEASVSPDPQMQAMGTMVLASLARSELIASEEELMLLDAVWVDPIAEAEEAGLDEELSGDGVPDADGGPDAEDGP
ncbi:hypothetical protein [Sinomonas halotolerans]|uniref:Uncharacterized protein n=1 Tax=Sinomonas halotolerans TaxID=1644133 RepID=A0ABU9X000_9MICC